MQVEESLTTAFRALGGRHAVAHVGLAIALIWLTAQFFLANQNDALDVFANGAMVALYGAMLLASHHTIRGYVGAFLVFIAGWLHPFWAFFSGALPALVFPTIGIMPIMCVATGIGLGVIAWIGTARSLLFISISASGVVAAVIAQSMGLYYEPLRISDLAWPTLPLHLTIAATLWWSSRHATPMRPASHAHLCHTCDYDLRGNTTGICPECGLAIAPAPAAQRPG